MKTTKKLLTIVSAFAAVTLTAPIVWAAPYASGITNNNGTIQFYLNELPTSVVVTFEDSSSNTLSSPVVGVNSFSLGSHTSYSIAVKKTGSGTITELSSDANTLNKFTAPRGVAVSRNPADSSFGRIYVSEAYGNGIFMRNSDQSDFTGQGTVAANGRTVGLNNPGSTYSFFKLSVGSDGTVYIGSTSTNPQGGYLGYADKDILTGGLALEGYDSSGGSGFNHTEVCGTPCVTGSIAGGDLVITAIDMYYSYFNTPTSGPESGTQDGLSLEQWNIGSGPFPSPVVPADVASSGFNEYLSNPNGGNAPGLVPLFLTTDGFVGTNNYYILLYRANPNSPGDSPIQVFNTNGVVVWDSFTNSIQPGVDLFANCFGGAISLDGRYLATIRSDGRSQFAVLTNDAFGNAIPDEATLYTNTAVGTVSGIQYGQVYFDAADNLYTIAAPSGSTATGLLRVCSLGLSTLATTSNDSTGTNGTFNIEFLPPVSVFATSPNASQNYGTPISAVFTITNESGSLSSEASDLLINFTMGGTGTNGVNYTLSTNGVTLAASATNTVIIPAGHSSVQVTLTPTPGGPSLPILNPAMTILAGTGFSAAFPTTAAVTISNTQPQVLTITGVSLPDMYRGLTNDFASATITRYGDLANKNGGNGNGTPYTVNTFTLGGTAVLGTDYKGGAGPITINPGDVTKTVTVSHPLPHASYTGNETIIVGLNSSGSAYTANPGIATLTLVDNLYQYDTPEWSDPLTSASDSTNWDVAFGGSEFYTVSLANYPNYTAGNAPYDYDVEFGYPLATDGVGRPPNGSPYALKATCNENDIYNCGVSIYPMSAKFGGNFALRFNMCLVASSNGTAQYGQFGINHYGTNNLWWAGGTQPPPSYGNTNIDGVWYSISAVQGYSSDGDLLAFTGQPLPNAGWKEQFPPTLGFTEANFSSYFKHPVPFNAPGTGSPANAYTNANSWVDVEVKQIGKVVTMSIDKEPFFTYTNTSIYTNGDIMLGFCSSVATPVTMGGAAYFSNVRVVPLTTEITSAVLSGNNLVLNFSSADPSAGDTTSSFAIQSSPTIQNPNSFTDIASQPVITGSSGVWQTTIPISGSSPVYFYRIRHK